MTRDRQDSNYESARELRKGMTRPERALWALLGDRRLAGYKFRRQHPIGPYVVDFYCASARLALEVDGKIHEAQADDDLLRQRSLEEQGVHFLRLPASLVLRRPLEVLEMLLVALDAPVPGSSRDHPIVRPTARIVVLDPHDRVLLFRVGWTDQDSGRTFWFMPGGGIESGESPEAAAARELFEETGVATRIGPCVWVRAHTWQFPESSYGQRWVRSVEQYFVARHTSSDVTDRHRSPAELADPLTHHWWSVSEMAGSTDLFVPRRLPELLPPLLRGELPDEPLDVGV